ncbi:dermonecrotic toxin domain-containing protein [Pseudomonas sp. microsymbiont 2]
MATITVPSLTLKDAVARQFAHRPTLRQVLGRECFKILVRHYPLVISSYPHLDSLAGFTLMRARDATGWVRYTPLLDYLLEVFLVGGQVALTDDDHLSLNPPHRFRAAEVITRDMSPSAVNLHLSQLNDDLDQLLSGLVDRFQQAQVSFWNGSEADVGVVRVDWMMQMLKAALARNVEHQGLSEPIKTLLYGVLMGNSGTVQVHAVECCMTVDGSEYRELLPNLLISGEAEEGSLLVWCEPSASVQVFDDILGFAEALRNSLAARYRFDTLSWSRSLLQGDPFSGQARLLLQCTLERVERLKLWQADTIHALEACFEIWSDPSRDLPETVGPSLDLPTVELPAWLSQASSADRFEYQMALQEQGARQALSKGVTSLDGIETLHAYTVRRLSERMQADHPQRTPYDPDQLLITLAVPDPAVDVELPAALKPARRLSLTELAYTQPSVEALEVVTGVTRADGQAVNGWMNPAYVNQLVAGADIGGTYPAYAGRLLDDSAGQADRIARFATEWRSALLFQALRAKIEGHLDEECWQVVAAFCRSTRDFAEYLSIAPLAFKCAPGAKSADKVLGMFVIRFNLLDKWILYRPMYETQAILPFAGLDALMVKLRETGELQQNVLDWLPDDVRSVYDNGGFSRPHLHDALKSIMHLLTLETDNVATYLESLREPAKATPKFWLADLDARMYQARGQMLLMLASRQTVSNAQRRWAIANQMGWLLFNLVTPMLPGPLAAVTWLAALVHSLPDDFRALASGDDAQKSLALVDVLNNLAMLLVHGQGAKDGQATLAVNDNSVTLQGPPRRMVPWEAPASVFGEQAGLSGEDVDVQASRPVRVVEAPAPEQAMEDRAALQACDWNEQRFNVLTPSLRAQLATYEASISLSGRLVERQWPMRGLVKVDGHLYLALDGRPYEVRVDWGSARIVTSDGREGPWLRPGGEGWELDLGLRGGSGRGRAAGAASSTRRNQAKGQEILKKISACNTTIRGMNDNISKMQETLNKDNADLKLQRAAVHAPGSTAYKRMAVLEASVKSQLVTIRETAQKREGIRYSMMVHNDDLLALLDKAKKGKVPFLNHDERYGVSLRLLVGEGFTLLSVLTKANRSPELSEARERAFAANSDLAVEWPIYQRALREAVENEELMIRALALIDKRVVELPPEAQVSYLENSFSREQLIEQRQQTYVDYRFHAALGYANLALDVTRVTDVHRLARVSRQLAGLSLRVVSAAHRNVLMSDVSIDDRLEILQTAWRRYGNAIVKADVLLHRDTETYDPEMIRRYKARMNELKDAMAADLLRAQAQAEGEPVAVEISPYPVKTGYRAVRTRAQILVIASEVVQEDGTTVLQVIEPLSNRVLLQFEANEHGDWVQTGGAADLALGDESGSESGSVSRTEAVSRPVSESEAESESDTESSSSSDTASATAGGGKGAQLIDIARHLETQALADSARVEAIARGYLDGDAGSEALIELVNGHLQQLEDARAALQRAGEQTERIEARIAQWQTNKENWLTQLYKGTAYPDLEALRFLFEHGRLRITYRSRSVIANGSAMDEYMIHWLNTPHGSGKGTELWVAHFHFDHQGDVATAFTRGHLKIASQRMKKGPGVNYGRITYEQVKDIIPFNR